MKINYIYKKQAILFGVILLIVITGLVISREWYKENILLVGLLYLIGMLPFLLLRSKVEFDESSGNIHIKTYRTNDIFNISEIIGVTFPKYEKYSTVETVPYQVCEIEYGKKKKLIQLAYRTYKKDDLRKFLEYIFNTRPDLGKFDERVFEEKLRL